MTAHVSVQIRIKDRAKLKEYASQAPATVAAHGGRFIVRGNVTEVLSGNADLDVVAMIEFPDAETARRWYNSAEYQALIPIREQGADMVFALVEMP
ncbi:DUF1330 domain-containing protein [Minwuia thermotolerans]|uniref:DUF1330 domain-containing protein n=1 Tax=Minwuia thermotolerans TaxID=2056226 RepID=A0A2M9G2S3_9PROT|nr:DUF1330 domain-containing protein [Minwuia thermotolerans]PJK30005.1 DUF1330 domain-containing protein [Minwuia thermotolerans]